MTGAAASLHHVDIEIRFGEAHKREFIVNAVPSLLNSFSPFFLNDELLKRCQKLIESDSIT